MAFPLQIDPEARPTVLDLLLAMREISRGAPLPPYELSPEAVQRRAARIAADEVRKAKAKKKTGPTVPEVKRAAPPSVNSVAAKRLAAKRGGSTDFAESGGTEDFFSASPEASHSQSVHANNLRSVSVEAAGFDPFNDNQQSNSSPSFPPAQQNSTFLVDAWGNPPEEDLFAASTIKSAPASATFDPFATEDNPSTTRTSFTATPAKAPTSSSVGSSSSAKNHIVAASSTSTFDPFAVDDVAAAVPVVSATKPASQRGTSGSNKSSNSVASSLFGSIDEAPAPGMSLNLFKSIIMKFVHRIYAFRQTRFSRF